MNKSDAELYQRRGWIIQGLVFGLIMYLITIFIFPLFTTEEITLEKSLIGIPAWLIGGLAYGYIMKVLVKKKIV